MSDDDRQTKPTPDLTATDDRARSSSAIADDPDVPRAIGRFIVERQLGVGGFGRVLLARDPTLDRPVAIKLLHHAFGGGDVARSRLLREAQAMAKLRHPNVVSVHEAGTHDGHVFLVLEYVARGTLRERIEGASLPAASVLGLFGSAGRGLAAAHAAGLVHRDFKPDNVLIDDGEVAKVTDFGLASRDDSVPARDAPAASDTAADADDGLLALRLTRTGDVLGTPRYMAPEQHEAKPTDARTDQFAFCVALYEALYGQPPFRGTTLPSLRAHVLNEPPRPAPPRDDVPPRVSAAILRGLSREPAARFPSMDALLAELEPARPSGKRWLVVGLAVLLAASAIASVLLTRKSEPASAIASRAARQCDCELLTLRVPPGARVIAVRQVVGSLVLPLAIAPAWQPTGQLAVPIGPHVIDYRVGDAQLSYSVISRGPTSSRTIELPAPEVRDGFVFIPGGDIVIGDPAATVTLEPYLIGVREYRDGVTYKEASDAARDAHARLPTAAEWDWAARLGVIDGALTGGWEWTATRFAPYPYIVDGRDDMLAARKRSEVRGGAPQIAERREGQHAGRADLRLARTARSVKPLSSVEIEFASEEDPSNPSVSKTVIAAPALVRLHRFLVDWWQLDDRPPLLVTGDGCYVAGEVEAAGVPSTIIDSRDNDNATETLLQWHSDRGYTSAGRIRVCDTSTEVLDMICFDKEAISANSEPILKAVAVTLNGNPKIRLMEVRAYSSGPDAVARTQRRAELVRARLIALGVAASRLRARGGGDVAAPTVQTPENAGLFEAPPADPHTCDRDPGGRVAFEILEKD